MARFLLVLRREFGIDEDTLFRRWSYRQCRTFLAVAPEVLGDGGEGADSSGALDVMEAPLELLRNSGHVVR